MAAPNRCTKPISITCAVPRRPPSSTSESKEAAMIRRTLAIALATVLLPLSAHAADLLQVYEMARNGDPQLSAAESTRLFDKEGAVQARAALLPQINGVASLNRSRTEDRGN